MEWGKGEDDRQGEKHHNPVKEAAEEEGKFALCVNKRCFESIWCEKLIKGEARPPGDCGDNLLTADAALNQ